MINHQHYTYQVTWSKEDQEFIGLCAEFPSLSHLDEEPTSALAGILELVRDIVAEMELNGEKPPLPLSDREFREKSQIQATS